jgi:ribosomal protein S18 acetylase RimI-like enzyme
VSELIRESEIRAADIERDADLIKRIDTSFESRTVFEVRREARCFQLVERAAEPPVAKTFPLALDDVAEAAHQWEQTWLALDSGQPVGVVATQTERWNRRVIVWHFYVNPSHRGHGIGRRLLEVALDAAREAGALTAWLETSSLNVPGIRAYERFGFELCGLDTSLYEGTEAAGEVAVFLSRSLTAVA